MTQALTIPTPATLAQAVEFGIGAWIHEKFGHTRSEKTKTAYSETILAFRQLLQREGLDLTWDPGEGESEAQVRQRLALYAQAFASTRLPGSRHKGEIAPATKNQRVAILRRRHLSLNRRGIVTLDFERCKGAKSTRDTLDEVVSTVLILWVQVAYNTPLTEMDADAAIWMDLAHPTRAQEPLGYQGIAGVCRHYLDTSKVHTTRHSFALLMQAIGAKLTEILKVLLHSNAATTGLYLDTITRNQNQFIGKLTALLGVSGMMAKLLAAGSEE